MGHFTTWMENFGLSGVRPFQQTDIGGKIAMFRRNLAQQLQGLIDEGEATPDMTIGQVLQLLQKPAQTDGPSLDDL